jgi:sensor histidine kinase regulating citrate/malate metabolism
VWVKVDRYSGQVRVEIGDTGQGMSEDFISNRLFKPFSQHQAQRHGHRQYESAQYIRELGGSIQWTASPAAARC